MKRQEDDSTARLLSAIERLDRNIAGMKTDGRERLYTVSDLAAVLKSNQDYVRSLIRAGLLKVMKLGCLKTTQKELDRFLDTYMGWDLTDPFHPMPP